MLRAIDIEKYDRKYVYEHYKNELNCSYSVTINVNITNLISTCRSHSLKTYPAIIFAITNAVNKVDQFKMELDSNGDLAIWDSVNPLYTMLNKETKIHYSVWAEVNTSLTNFNKEYLNDIALYSNSTTLNPKKTNTSNFINISALPWFSFTGFNINVDSKNNYYLPFFTIGKYYKHEEEILMPLSIQVHHAVADGYHVSLFLNELDAEIRTIHTKV